LSHRPSTLGAALFFGLFMLAILFAPQRAASAERVELACPNGRTVFLEGAGPPRTALLVFLDGRPVGGGSTDARGAYRLPLTPRERPGIYNVDVRTRAERSDVGRFTCYVDVPLNVQPTPTPEIVVTAAPPGAPTPTPNLPGVTPTATAATGPGGTPAPTATPTSTATPGTGYPPPPGNNATPTNTPSPTSTTGAPEADVDISIIEIVLREPGQELDPQAEFVTLSNDGDTTVNLAGWRLTNTSRTDQLTFTFPAYTFEAGLTVVIYSGAGTNDPDEGEFYWGQTGNIWSQGHRANLRDNSGRSVDTFIVGQE
jgi:hypothetical protein